MSAMAKRLDQWLVDSAKSATRSRAQDAIKNGKVSVNGTVTRKVAQRVGASDEIAIAPDADQWVSRGAIKLVAGLAQFAIEPLKKTCLDIGASTGGFSEVLLRGGAKKIYAVDVGHGQLHDRLAGQRDIVNLERTDARRLTADIVPEAIDLLVCDASFISIEKMLAPALSLVAPEGEGILLIKPQFELSPDHIGKGGIVKASREIIETMIEERTAWVNDQGFATIGLIESPIKGSDGNQEYLMGIRKI